MDSTENPFLYTLRLPVKMPFSVKFSVIVAHVLSLFFPWFTGLDLNLKVIASCFVVISLCYYLKIYFYSPDEIKVSELILDSEDQWTVRKTDGQVFNATLGDTQFVHPLMTIVSIKQGKQTGYYIFTREVLDKDLFRRLRVRLRYKAVYEE